METFGILSLIPVLVIILVAIATRTTFESIFLGVVVGFVLLAKGNPMESFNLFLDSIYTVLLDDGTLWVLLVVATFGSLIAVLEKSGGVLGFSSLTEKVVKSRKSSMLTAWILGIIIFVDDYLNSLAVGSAMKGITDKYKVSREMLAFIVNATGATVCVIVPFSTWSAFMAGQMESNSMTGALSATSAYIKTIPFMVYPILAVFVVPFVILNIIPLFGPMKKAEKRAIETGEVLSEESKRVIEDLPHVKVDEKKHKAFNFILPMILLTFVTVYSEDMLLGVFAALGFSFLLYIPQRLMKVKDFTETVVKGMTDMFPVIILIILAFVFQEANAGLGLTDYIINSTKDVLNPSYFPVIMFIVVSFLAFTTGTFWSLAAIVFPIAAPITAALGIDPFIVSGAIISGIAFGAQACLYSDTVLLTSASTQASNVDYVRTSLPILMIPFVLTTILYVIIGVTLL
jgi:Na+/H+ antiporter NhaC